MPKDPVCGKSVNRDTPFQSDIGGETLFFCSEECQEQFELEADEFFDTAPPEGARRRGAED